MSGSRSGLSAVLFLAVVGIAGCGRAPSSSAGSAAILSPSQQQNAAKAPPDETLKWLDEEIGYIISPAELRVFKLLKKRDEREQFIAQFWQRRDPKPETTQNEFRDEFYRRVEYANIKYKEHDPGWKTDRGRVYIVYGPPDDLRTAPMGSGRRCEDDDTVVCPPFPFERWRYREMAAVGLRNVLLQFVDDCICNEYRLMNEDGIREKLLPETVEPETANKRF